MQNQVISEARVIFEVFFCEETFYVLVEFLSRF